MMEWIYVGEKEGKKRIFYLLLDLRTLDMKYDAQLRKLVKLLIKLFVSALFLLLTIAFAYLLVLLRLHFGFFGCLAVILNLHNLNV